MSAAPMDLALLDPEQGCAVAPRALRRPARPALVLVPAPASRPAGRIRVTRIGRLAATLLATVVVVTAAVLGITGLGAASTAPHPVTVQAGQTLSEIAARELPDVPVRDAVADIAVANNLAGTQVRAGQVLLIPAGG